MVGHAVSCVTCVRLPSQRESRQHGQTTAPCNRRGPGAQTPSRVAGSFGHVSHSFEHSLPVPSAAQLIRSFQPRTVPPLPGHNSAWGFFELPDGFRNRVRAIFASSVTESTSFKDQNVRRGMRVREKRSQELVIRKKKDTQFIIINLMAFLVTREVLLFGLDGYLCTQ